MPNPMDKQVFRTFPDPRILRLKSAALAKPLHPNHLTEKVHRVLFFAAEPPRESDWARL